MAESCSPRHYRWASFWALLEIFARILVATDARPCIANQNCPIRMFCTRNSFASLSGTCISCWQCCLFPDVYGGTATCGSHCRCSPSAPCYLDADCGPGEFCAMLLSRSELPVCQPCQLCRNDSQAWSGSCADACPSGALDDNGVPQGVERHYVFAAFDIANHPTAREGLSWTAAVQSGARAAVVNVTESALRLWLADAPAFAQDALISPTLLAAAGVLRPDSAVAQNPRIVPLAEFAARLAAVAPHRDLLCPQLPTATAADINATTVPEGCPCNATVHASGFRCPAGQRCSPGAWLSLPTDMITLAGTALLKARCVACDPGTHCPEGTFVEERDDLNFMASLACPAGYYCPTPAEKFECPVGYFCPVSSIVSTMCDYVKLLASQQTIAVTSDSYGKLAKDTIQTVVADGEPLRGNYCPNRSSTPKRSCRPGYYCPNTSLELLCPHGHYCRAETIAPKACPPLALCNAGSSTPRIWPAALAVFGGLVLSVSAIGLVAMSLDHSEVQKLPSQADQDKRAAAAQGMRRFVSRFHGDQLMPSTRQVWVVAPRELEVRNLRWTGNGRSSDRPVLQSVSGCFLAGQLSAILGPSGCGKSSLLALLAGRDSHWPLSGGEILVNGVKVTGPGDLKYATGFVPQDDILCTELTVQENLEYSAALRLPRLSRKASRANCEESLSTIELNAQMVTSPLILSRCNTNTSAGSSAAKGSLQRSRGGPGVDGEGRRSQRGSLGGSSSSRGFTYSAAEERRLLVEEVLRMLDLKMLRDQRVGGMSSRSLSGGQRKRVNIGVELVARPPVLLLDEPTSGLDAACSSDVLASLSDMAEERLVNVIMVVHQPRRSVYRLFSTVVLLDRQGVSVYHGDARKAEVYFRSLGYPPISSHENVPDRLLDIIMGKCYNQCGVSTKELSSYALTLSNFNSIASSQALGASLPMPGLSPGAGPGAPLPHSPGQSPSRKPNFNRMRPALTEELAGVIEGEYDIILGPDAVKRGCMLDRKGLLRLLRHLGQEGPEVEDFVQGILEETGRRRRQQQHQQLQQQQLNMSDANEELAAGIALKRQPGQQQRQEQPGLLQHGYSQQNGNFVYQRSSKSMQLQPPPPPQQQQHNSRSQPGTGLAPSSAFPSGVYGAASAVTSKELLAALEMVQCGKLKSKDLNIRFSDLTSSRPSRTLGVVNRIGETLHNAAQGLRKQLSTMLAAAGPRNELRSRPLTGGPSKGGGAFSLKRSVMKGLSLQRLRWQDDLTEHMNGGGFEAPAPSSPRLSTMLLGTADHPCGGHLRCGDDGDKRGGAVHTEAPAAEATELPSDSGQLEPRTAVPILCDTTPNELQCKKSVNGWTLVARVLAKGTRGPTWDDQGVTLHPTTTPMAAREARTSPVHSEKMGQPKDASAFPARVQQAYPSFPVGQHANGGMLALLIPSSPTSPRIGGQMLPSPFAQFSCHVDGDSNYGPGKVSDVQEQEGDVVKSVLTQREGEGVTASRKAQEGAGSYTLQLQHQEEPPQQQQQQQQQQHSSDVGVFSAQASRRHPSWLSQLYTFTQRALLQSTRAFWPSSMFEVVLLLAAAAAIGANQGSEWGPAAVPGNAVISMLCLAVLAVVLHLRTFACNRLVLQRERGVGLSSSAYFISRCLADVPWIVIAPVFFSLPYYILTVPRASYLPYYVVSVGVWWWASGLSYLVTVLPFMPPAAAPTAAVLSTLIAGALLNGVSSPSVAEARGSAASALLFLSYNRWAVEALTVSELNEYLVSHGNVIARIYQDKGICGLDKVIKIGFGDLTAGDDLTLDDALWPLIHGADPFIRGFCNGAWRTDLIILFCLGLGLRAIACITLKYDARITSVASAVWGWCFSRYESARAHLRVASHAASASAKDGDVASEDNFGADLDNKGGVDNVQIEPFEKRKISTSSGNGSTGRRSGDAVERMTAMSTSSGYISNDQRLLVACGSITAAGSLAEHQPLPSNSITRIDEEVDGPGD